MLSQTILSEVWSLQLNYISAAMQNLVAKSLYWSLLETKHRSYLFQSSLFFMVTNAPGKMRTVVVGSCIVLSALSHTNALPTFLN